MKTRLLALTSASQCSFESDGGPPHSKTLRNEGPSEIPDQQAFGTGLATLITAIVGLTALSQSVSYAATPGKVFTRPEDAVAALRNATSSADTNVLRELFG